VKQQTEVLGCVFWVLGKSSWLRRASPERLVLCWAGRELRCERHCVTSTHYSVSLTHSLTHCPRYKYLIVSLSMLQLVSAASFTAQPNSSLCNSHPSLLTLLTFSVDFPLLSSITSGFFHSRHKTYLFH